MTTFQVVNPFTGESGAVHPPATDAQLDRALDAAERAWTDPSLATTVAERAAAVAAIADLHRERRDELAQIIVREMGKPLAQAIGEVDFCEAIYRYYADNATDFLADEQIATAAGTAWIRKSPLGPVLGVMPWNFPLYQIARFAAPNLILGNPVLVKPAPQCPDSASALDAIVQAAGVRSGGYATVLADEQQIAAMIADPRVQGVSLTGSERAGMAIGSAAGAHLKKCVLELGGSDPFIVFSTDDMDATIAAAVDARIGNNGQICNGAKRFLIADELYEEFAERLGSAFAAIVPGDPLDDATELGPLSSVAAARTLEGQVTAALAAGATLRVGTGRRDGTLFAPTLLENVTPDNPAFGEEFFGPVGQLYRFGDEQEAIRIANATPYGLGSFVYTTDPAQAERVASRLQVGMVYINEVGTEAPELPFGGVKNSGTGRELGAQGIEEFMNRKLVKRP